MLDLGDILKLVNDSFYQRSFAEQKLIGQDYQAVLHILAQLGNQLEMEILPEMFKERFGYIILELCLIHNSRLIGNKICATRPY